jgi:penicillin-binding protein 1A
MNETPSTTLPVEAGGTSTRRRTATILGLVAAAIILVALLASLAGVRVMAAAAAVLPGTSVPDDLEFGDLDQRSVVVSSDGTELARLGPPESRDPVPLAEVSEHMVNAVIAAEDRRFHDHDGYDPGGIIRAAFANLRAGGVEQGGSSITQQLAKVNFTGGDQTLGRKAAELRYAVRLEDRYSKDELLERYLNQVYFGAQAYGVAAAAQEYFRVPPSELAPEQAALLAGIIRAPSALEPRGNPDAAKQRRDAVLEAMAEEGYLSRAEAQELIARPVEVAEPTEGDHREEHREPYVVEYVTRHFIGDDRFGADEEEREQLLMSGGIEITTTIDVGVQELAREIVTARTEQLGEGPAAAIASVEPGTGRILALYSGGDFGELQFDLATQGRRQPGSAYKPFVAATALEQGIPIGQPLTGDSPAFFPDVRGWDEEGEGVRNFEDADLGTVDLREAMVRSANTAFAELILMTGHEPVMELTDRLGINGESAYDEGDGPAIALGGLGGGVTPLEMASAYATFAAGGTYARPHLIQRVVDRSGEELYVAEAETDDALDETVSAGMVELMRGVVDQGTGTAAAVEGWEVAGKTGTTQNNADAWFVGFAPVLSTAVWVGHPEAQVPMPGMTGGSVPATIFNDFMGAVLGTIDPVPFPEVDISPLLDGAPADRPAVEVDEQAEPSPEPAPAPPPPPAPEEPPSEEEPPPEEELPPPDEVLPPPDEEEPPPEEEQPPPEEEQPPPEEDGDD